MLQALPAGCRLLFWRSRSFNRPIACAFDLAPEGEGSYFVDVLTDDFDYDLPPELIADHPADCRDQSRLMVVNRRSGNLGHHRFCDLPQWLRAGDVIVLNNSKVLNARLFGQNTSGKTFEVLLLKPIPSSPLEIRWECLVRPGKAAGESRFLSFPGDFEGVVTRGARSDFEIVFSGYSSEQFYSWLDRYGHVPLPPYIRREDCPVDREKYQTVYAKESGSVAAPTAGLHFTRELLEELRRREIEIVELTLHIGYGTFAPIRTREIEEHTLHSESYDIPFAALEKIHKAEQSGRRIIAVGTTSLRALESLPSSGRTGSTSLYIRPSYSFRYCHGLITNFHLPRTSLYVLVCAFLGTDATRACYREAMSQKYRFFSYGDAMLIL